MNKPLSITYVQYQKGDIIGELLAYSSLAPVFTIVSFTALFVMNRNIRTMYFLIGQLLNEAFNLVLKHLIKEERPADLLGDGSYGMPSSHTQFMWFFTTYSTMYLMRRIPPVKLRRWRGLVLFALYCLTIGVTTSRIYLGYHTVSQVLAGLGIGCLTGTCWYILLGWMEILFPSIILSKLGTLLEIEDLQKSKTH
jgi:dolichyldiphosphatase